MRYFLSILWCPLLWSVVNGQDVSLFVDGGLRIGNFIGQEAEAGTIRWTGDHFEAFTGLFWTQLEGGVLYSRGPGPGPGSGEISEVDGAIQMGKNQIGEYSKIAPNPGTIRWSGSDFQGWNGVFWVSLSGNSLYDVDGNTYKTVVIGNQEWMKENLRTGRYLNGDPIPLVSDDTEWQGRTTGAYSWYNNQNIDENEYGKLYNWYAVTDVRKLCPTGWRIPTSDDWVVLINFLGGANLAGGKLKEAGLRHWTSPNTDATNESGFHGVAAGIRSFNGSYIFQGNSGSWWSSSSDATLDVYTQSTGYNSGISSAFYNDRRSGISVRCLKN